MRERRWLLLAIYGLLLASAVSGAIKATRPKFKIATTTTTTSTTEEPDVADNEDGEVEATTASSDVNGTTSRVLTGIPQIDYIWDPNLPRELNGFNLSDYPFYNGIPPEITFKCEGLHDGFYASVLHKCQVYHHCLHGTRYDFLCANFTAFDQRTFICQFASEVDCANSKNFWHRNDALYKSPETTTTSTTTTSTTTTSQPPSVHGGARPDSRRRRPYRRRPAYDYYEEDYYDEETYERTRPRGYDRRDDYEYADDRKYMRRDRERDRNFRDRDYRERETPRSREPVERPMREPERPIKDEPPLSPRERFPSRGNNRREPPVRTSANLPRDSVMEDEPRNRNREQDSTARVRIEHEESSSIDDRRSSDTRNRDVDERRYSDKGYADDYEDEPVPAVPASSSGTSELLVKPAAPVSSVYAKPRAPPKIRRPVPITEQEKFAYKATPVPPTAAVEARRRPIDVVAEDDYYEDAELEEVRPRRPMSRRRPGFRDFFENPRERERDRPFRTRYREDVDDVRPRKHQERNRERYYERGPERGRDRSLDRSKERIAETTREKTGGKLQETDRPLRPIERDNERTRSSSMRTKEFSEILETTRRPNIYERTSVASPITSTTSTEISKDDVTSPNSSDRQFRNGNRQENNQKIKSETIQPSRQSISENIEEHRQHQTSTEPNDDITTRESDKSTNTKEEYSSSAEYYDEPEYHTSSQSPIPRTPFRIVKRPFLPSRGGNPNPRGLSPVGSKARVSSTKEEAALNGPQSVKNSQDRSEVYHIVEDQQKNGEKSIDDDDRRNYDNYKNKDIVQTTRSDDYEQVLSRPGQTRKPIDNGPREEEQSRSRISNNDNNNNDRNDDVEDNFRGTTSRNAAGTRGRQANDDEEATNGNEKSALKWNSDEYRLGQRGDVRHSEETTHSSNTISPTRSNTRLTENSGYYDTSYDNGERDRQTNLSQGNLATSKQTLNEVVTHHRLQDIPESEYDVTLNEALTPSFNNQETNLPSGFVLPLHHRQLPRDPILQSTENSYKISRPYNQQISSSQQSHQQLQQQQQKPFVPSPQFLPLGGIGSSGNGNDRSRSVQYFRTPEAVHVTGPQYRHQRGPWHDYTGY